MNVEMPPNADVRPVGVGQTDADGKMAAKTSTINVIKLISRFISISRKHGIKKIENIGQNDESPAEKPKANDYPINAGCHSFHHKITATAKENRPR